jgi:hypothetical protein
LVAEAGSAVQRMQKALTEMNVQLSNVLSDLSGVSGMNIMQAILDGERDPQTLAAMPGVKATPEDIAKSLEGNWREELLFVLSTEPQWRFAMLPGLCCAAKVTWARNTAACAPGWALPRRSPPWLES